MLQSFSDLRKLNDDLQLSLVRCSSLGFGSAGSVRPWSDQLTVLHRPAH